MSKRTSTVGAVIVAMGTFAFPALADHNCCQVDDWCASSAGVTASSCTDAGGTYFASIGCKFTGVCVEPKLGNPPPICSDNAPPEECSAFLNTGIPAVSTWGLATMGLLVAAAGTVLLLRRKARIAA